MKFVFIISIAAAITPSGALLFQPPTTFSKTTTTTQTATKPKTSFFGFFFPSAPTKTTTFAPSPEPVTAKAAPAPTAAAAPTPTVAPTPSTQSKPLASSQTSQSTPNYQAIIQEKDATISNQKAQIAAMAEKAAQLISQKDQVISNLTAQLKEVAQNRTNAMEDLKNQEADLNSKISNITQQIAQKMKERNTTIDSLSLMVNGLVDRKNSLEAQKNDLALNVTNTISALKSSNDKEIADLNSANDAKLKQRDQDIAALNYTIADLKNNYAATANAKAAMETDYMKKISDLKAMLSTLNVQKTQLSTILQAQTDRLKTVGL